MFQQTQNAVLELLNKEPRSTKALMTSITDFADRESASIFLNGMFRHGLIKKQANGYWRCTAKGQGILNGMDIDTADSGENATDFVMPPSDEAVKPAQTVDQVLEEQPKPETEAPQIFTTWPSINGLQKLIPSNASLVIERDSAFFVFANHQFEVTQNGDFEAFTRMADCHIGSINGQQLLKTGE